MQNHLEEIVKDALKNNEDPVAALNDYLEEKDSHLPKRQVEYMVRSIMAKFPVKQADPQQVELSGIEG